MGDITLYKAGFEIECWHDFCGPCSWREGKRCLLLDTGLKLDANESSVSYWRKWIPAEKARAAVKKLSLTVYGSSELVPSHEKQRKALPGLTPSLAPELPLKGARNEV